MPRRYFQLFIIGLCLIYPLTATASKQSDELIHQGALDLQKRHYKAALDKFKQASEADPNDAQALFFQGAALNRMGNFKEALNLFQQADKLGCKHPGLAFEQGWSLLKLQQFKDAVAQLEQYERFSPGSGQTSEFLGRAYLGLGEFDKAEAALKQAIERDPKLKPTIQLCLVELEQKRDRPEAAKQYLKELLEESANSAVGRAVKEQVERQAGLRKKPWKISASVGGGYNSNVINLGDSIALPSDISRKHASFLRSSISGSYNWRLASSDVLSAGFALLSDVYSNISKSNLLDNYWYIDYAHAFSKKLIALFRLSDEYSLIGDKHFRNQSGVRPAAIYRFNDWTTTEMSYYLANSNYYFRINNPDQNRDGLTHTVSLTQYFTPKDSKLKARLGYFYTVSASDGTDFDYDINGVILGLNYPLCWKINGDISYTHSANRYDHPNSLAGPSGYEFTRNDNIDALTLRLTRPLNKQLTAYAQYNYTNDDSNLPFYDYDQYVWSAGITATF